MTNANPKIVITASDQTKAAFDSASRSLSTLSTKAQAVSASFKGLALVGAGVAFAGMVKNLAEAGDKLQKLSVKTGIAVEDLSKLDYAASLSDLSMEDLGAALVKLNRVMGDAANGSQEATDALARFGVAPDSGQAALEVFKQIADRVKATGDETRIASALNDVLGKSFGNLIPLLKGGSDGIKEAGDELAKLGGVMSGDLARDSEKFNDNLTKINKSLDALKIGALSGVIAGLEKITSQMVLATKASGSFAQGLGLWMTVSGKETDNPGQAIDEITKKLKTLKSDQAALSKGGSFKQWFNADDLAIVNKQIEFLTTKLSYLRDIQPAEYGNEGIAFRMKQAEQAGILDTPKKQKPGKAKKEDAYTDLLTPAAQAYAKAIESLNKNLLDAEKSTLKLDDAESMLYDLMKSAVWQDMPEPWKELVTAQTEAASAAIKIAEKTKELNDLIAATPTAKLEEMRGKMMLLAEAFEEGKISAEVFSEAAQTALGTLSDSAKEATDEMSEFAVQAARNMQDAFAEFLFDPFKDGTKGMLESFGIMIRKMVANAVAADLSKNLFGKSAGGEGDGLIGAGLNWLGKLLPSFDVGTNYVPRDMVAMVHQGERIVPASQNRGGGGHTIIVNVNGSNAPDVRRAAGQGAREGLAALAGAGRYS